MAFADYRTPINNNTSFFYLRHLAVLNLKLRLTSKGNCLEFKKITIPCKATLYGNVIFPSRDGDKFIEHKHESLPHYLLTGLYIIFI